MNQYEERDATHTEISKDAKEAIEILEWIKDNAGAEEFSNYGLAYGYIKTKGFVSPLFLSQIRARKEELEKKIG